MISIDYPLKILYNNMEAKVSLNKFIEGSLFKALQSIYPNHIWHPWKFQQNISIGFWENQNGGSRMLAKYGDSPPKVVKLIYSQHEWTLYRFDAVPKGHWNICEIIDILWIVFW